MLIGFPLHTDVKQQLRELVENTETNQHLLCIIIMYMAKML